MMILTTNDDDENDDNGSVSGTMMMMMMVMIIMMMISLYYNHLISYIYDLLSSFQFDTALQNRSYGYRGYRKSGKFSPPRVYLVKPGTFQVLQDFIVANSSASYNQFKLPRKLKTGATLDLVMGRVQNL